MNLRATSNHKLFKPALGALLTVICGLALWAAPLGDAWVNASYDYLFRFGSRAVTNNVALILMDNAAYDQFHQIRGQPWDRSVHARLLERLTSDGCPLVVFDSFFRNNGDPAKDASLLGAIRRAPHVVLMAEQADVNHPSLDGVMPTLPAESFLTAASNNWGVAWLDPDLDSTVRKHWPFPAPGPQPSLAWVAARLAGANLSQLPKERWLRYYGPHSGWTAMSYHFAFTQPTNYFHDKIVFIGNMPKNTVADGEADEFCTPYTRWTGETSGGTEILATEFLNLVNNEWLQRPSERGEAFVLIASGILLGGWLCQLRLLAGIGVAAAAALAVTFGAVYLSYAGNYWFPWLVIAGGQAPCALAWAVVSTKIVRSDRAFVPGPVNRSSNALVSSTPAQEPLDTPDYELFDPPFGEGAYGKVWLARNAIGQWQALKAVYRAKFGLNSDPYEREFNGIRNYKPISDRHPGLLRIDFVSRPQGAGYFYYVMELGDAFVPGWEQNPSTYRPCDLASLRSQTEGRRLPVAECVRIGLALTDALEFLHDQGLIHCDIKPQNIIFVNGQPKLADVGLISDTRLADDQSSSVGTPGYMPPPPEPSGTRQADIYSLGMVLYVIRTGFSPLHYPEISATLVEKSEEMDFAPLNAVILKACHPDRAQRYSSMSNMRTALADVQELLNRQTRSS